MRRTRWLLLLLVPASVVWAHTHRTGAAPTMGSCEISPSISGTDEVGIVTVGSGVVTACTVTFSQSWQSTPICVVNADVTSGTIGISAISPTALTLGFSISLPGAKLYYHCVGTS